MDAVSYSLASKQAQRIEKFIENPDSTSGILTQPSVIQTGEIVNVPVGRTAILANTQIDGDLVIDGTVFIPSGATLDGVVEKVASTDNAIVRFNGVSGEVQNSSIIVDDNGSLLLTSGTGALGYGTGAGGTVTQLTSKSTTVSLNKPSGVITMNNAALAAGASVLFALNNSYISAYDVLPISVIDDFGGIYEAQAIHTYNGYCIIQVINKTGASRSEAIRLSFVVIKGATA